MLAHPVGGFERITDEEWENRLYIQPKLDGVRYAASVSPILSSLALSLASLNSINN